MKGNHRKSDEDKERTGAYMYPSRLTTNNRSSVRNVVPRELSPMKQSEASISRCTSSSSRQSIGSSLTPTEQTSSDHARKNSFRIATKDSSSDRSQVFPSSSVSKDQKWCELSSKNSASSCLREKHVFQDELTVSESVGKASSKTSNWRLTLEDDFLPHVLSYLEDKTAEFVAIHDGPDGVHLAQYAGNTLEKFMLKLPESSSTTLIEERLKKAFLEIGEKMLMKGPGGVFVLFWNKSLYCANAADDLAVARLDAMIGNSLSDMCLSAGAGNSNTESQLVYLRKFDDNMSLAEALFEFVCGLHAHRMPDEHIFAAICIVSMAGTPSSSTIGSEFSTSASSLRYSESNNSASVALRDVASRTDLTAASIGRSIFTMVMHSPHSNYFEEGPVSDGGAGDLFRFKALGSTLDRLGQRGFETTQAAKLMEPSLMDFTESFLSLKPLQECSDVRSVSANADANLTGIKMEKRLGQVANMIRPSIRIRTRRDKINKTAKRGSRHVRRKTKREAIQTPKVARCSRISAHHAECNFTNTRRLLCLILAIFLMVLFISCFPYVAQIRDVLCPKKPPPPPPPPTKWETVLGYIGIRK